MSKIPEIPTYPVDVIPPNPTYLICKRCLKQKLLVTEHGTVFDGVCLACNWVCWNVIPEYYIKTTEALMKEDKKRE